MPSGSSLTRKSAAVLTLVAALWALMLAGAGPALAHAGLSGSDPADGAVLDSAPKQVTLTFTESVSFLDGSLRVLSPANDRVNPRQAQHADGQANTARVALEGNLAQGTYTVAWRVVSADGHPISGAFTFSIGKPSETTAVVAKTSPDDTAASRLYGFFRYVAYSGLALLVGAAAFVLVCWPGAMEIRPLRRLAGRRLGGAGGFHGGPVAAARPVRGGRPLVVGVRPVPARPNAHGEIGDRPDRTDRTARARRRVLAADARTTRCPSPARRRSGPRPGLGAHLGCRRARIHAASRCPSPFPSPCCTWWPWPCGWAV